MNYNFDQIIERRNTASIKWTQYPADVLPLWVADMDFLTPEPIRNAVHAMVDQGVLGYEFIQPHTREVVARRMERLYGWQVNPDWVVATTGVVSGFNIAARAVCKPGDGVLIHTPVYNMFYSLYKNLDLVQQSAPLALTLDGNVLHPELHMESFAGAFHSNNARTRMFLFCHPNNPLGKVYTREELQKMAGICLQNETLIVSDEIHSELLLDDSKHIPIAILSPEIADKTITLIAASKTFNTAGLFCAFAIIPNDELRVRFQRVNDEITGHVASVGLVASDAAFSGECDDWLAELRKYLKDNRDFVAEYLTENFPGARFTIPQATYLQWIDFSEYTKTAKMDKPPFDYFLEKAKVALSSGKIFGEGCENFVRFNFASPRQMVAEGLERMLLSLK
ncbi:MAG: MalY/PatB family protein [Bacteroidota bacterium]